GCDRRREACLRPSARQKQILPGRFRGRTARILLRRCGEGRPALADDLPRRKSTREAGDLRDIVPYHLGHICPWHVEQTTAIADRRRYPARQRKYPFARPVDDAKHLRQMCQRIDPEMTVSSSV